MEKSVDTKSEAIVHKFVSLKIYGKIFGTNSKLYIRKVQTSRDHISQGLAVYRFHHLGIQIKTAFRYTN